MSVIHGTWNFRFQYYLLFNYFEYFLLSITFRKPNTGSPPVIKPVLKPGFEYFSSLKHFFLRPRSSSVLHLSHNTVHKSKSSVVIRVGRQLPLSEFCTCPIILFTIVGLGRRSSQQSVIINISRHESRLSVVSQRVLHLSHNTVHDS